MRHDKVRRTDACMHDRATMDMTMDGSPISSKESSLTQLTSLMQYRMS